MDLDHFMVTPCFIKNYYSDGCFTLGKNYIVIGTERDGEHFKCQLFFSVEENTIIMPVQRAVLRLFCCSNTVSVNTLISVENTGTADLVYSGIITQDKGWYEWDVTEVINSLDSISYFNICLTASELKYSTAKKFCGQCTLHPPSLYLVSEQQLPNNTYELMESYISSEFWEYSRWIKCSFYKSYVYHIYNEGETPVDVFLNISPNKKYNTEASVTYTVSPKKLVVIEPLKYSFYIRTAFKNSSGNDRNPIKMWFQAQK